MLYTFPTGVVGQESRSELRHDPILRIVKELRSNMAKTVRR